jgi:DNA modification methylase
MANRFLGFQQITMQSSDIADSLSHRRLGIIAAMDVPALESRTRTRPLGHDPNRVRSQDLPVHRWYRFVLSFPPHLVRDYVARFGLSRGDTVLDPFCGTGTTLVECKKLGLSPVGIEANPLARFASQVKLDWTVDPDGLTKHAQGVAEAAQRTLEAEGISELGDLPLFSGNSHSDVELRTLTPAAEGLLLKNSISPLPLHKSLLLLDAIRTKSPRRYVRHETLGLARALVSGISNLEFGPEVGVGPQKPDAPVIEIWNRAVGDIASDLSQIDSREDGGGSVHLADSRQLSSILPADSVDAVITSPPYPNEKDYTRTTRLELVLLGFVQDTTGLRALKQSLVRSNTRGVYRTDSDDNMIKDNPAIQRIATAIEDRRLELGKTSGFERMYPRVTKLYFGGMARHFADLRAVLRPGAKLAYVVGDQASYLRVMIRTGNLLAEIAQALGYEILGIDLFRTRLATATREQLREEVLMLRWPGR